MYSMLVITGCLSVLPVQKDLWISVFYSLANGDFFWDKRPASEASKGSHPRTGL